MALYETLIEGGHEHLIDAVKARIAQKADAIVEDELKPIIENQPHATLEGELIVTDDAADLPPVMVHVDGRSTQDGTPTPENPIPIESVDALALSLMGKNLMPSRYNYSFTSYGVTFTFDSEGRYTRAGTATSTRTINLITFDSNLKWPAGNYVMLTDPYAGSGATKGPCLTIENEAGETRIVRQGNAYSAPFTLADGERPLSYGYSVGSGTTYHETVYLPMVVRAGESLTWEPYEGHTVPIDLQGYSLRSLPSGAKDELTLTYLRPSAREGWAVYAASLLQRVSSVDLGNLSGYEARPAYNKWYIGVPYSRSNVSVNQRMCSHYTVIPSQGVSYHPANNTIGPRSIDGSNTFYVRDDRFPPDSTSVADFKAGISGIRLDYLMNGTDYKIIDLGEMELPVLPSKHATIWSDPATGLKLTYVIDSETIEESLESGIGKAFSSVAPVETSPATDSHGIGSRIVYNETLYKVTSAIAAGEDIVPGTNVTPTTVAAELLATQA